MRLHALGFRCLAETCPNLKAAIGVIEDSKQFPGFSGSSEKTKRSLGLASATERVMCLAQDLKQKNRNPKGIDEPDILKCHINKSFYKLFKAPPSGDPIFLVGQLLRD